MTENTRDAVIPSVSKDTTLFIFEKHGVPLSYVEAVAQNALDYSTEEAALNAAVNPTEVDTSFVVNRKKHGVPRWRLTPDIAISVADYYEAGIDPADFHPLIEVRQVAAVKKSGHSVQVIGGLVTDDPFLVLQTALSLTPELALLALAEHVHVSNMRDIYYWGFTDFQLCSGNGRLFFSDLARYSRLGYSVETVTEALKAFKRQLVPAAIELGMTAEQIRAYRENGGPLATTAMDLKRIMNPGVPDEYIIAMG